MPFKPIKFISETVDVIFDIPPVIEKRPDCPDGFTWEGETYRVVENMREWKDFSRRGRMAHNMRPANMSKAFRRGSWGVGRFYFRVQTINEQVFDLYYDRAPKDVDNRLGGWYLDREMVKTENQGPEIGK